MKTHEKIIKKLNLSKHDEGGYFCQTYKSDLIVQPDRESYTRSSATHIYYYLSRGMHSRFHTVVLNNLWQAAEPIGDYVLVGCTVTPGWELEDEEYLSDHPEVIGKLGKLRPDLKSLI